MFLIFDNSEILNMDNVVSIETENYSDTEVRMIIVTTAIRYYQADFLTGPEHYNAYCKEFVIENKQWVELLEAIKNGKNVFAL